MLAAILLSYICRAFADGKAAPTANDLRAQTTIPIRLVNDMLYRLVEARLVLEVSPDEKGEASTFVPAESLDNLSLGVMIDRLEAQGRWTMSLPVKRLLSEKWAKAVAVRTDYLNQARDIRMEDLVTKNREK